MTAKIDSEERELIARIKRIVASARAKAYNAINFAQVEANWLIGQRIVEQKQRGASRAGYGKHIVELVSRELTAEFGRGFSETNIRSFRKFYLVFKDFQIQQAVPAEFKNRQALPAESPPSAKPALAVLSWTHYERLLRVRDAEARRWYMDEAATQTWDYRTFDKDIARYSILKGNEQLFATKYKLYLPTEEELRDEIERQKETLTLQFA